MTIFPSPWPAPLSIKAPIYWGVSRAVEKLSHGKNHFSIDKLKNTRSTIPFMACASDAAAALRSIHTDDSLQALLDSRAQSDARVRHRVMEDIGGFYDARAFDAEKQALPDEKNPSIAAAEIRASGNSSDTNNRALLVSYLKSNSYRNSLLAAAVSAMAASHDDFYLPPLMDAVKTRANELTSRELGNALSAVATLARDDENKDAPRELIAGFVASPKESVQTAAIRALGELEDPRADSHFGIVYATAAESDPNHQAAEKALGAIRSRRQPADQS